MDNIHTVISGILCGLCVALAMRYVPIFHGYDSKDIKRIVFVDPANRRKYTLVPEKILCK